MTLTKRNKRFFHFSLLVIGYIIAVIVWGAFVRATGSGAGCGRHWPLCNGEVVPRSPELSTFIEFGHRITSGISLLLVGALVIWAYRKFVKGAPVRTGAALSGIFLLIEAAFGAGLVLLELVAKNDSAFRAVAVSLHLVNTFFLLASLAFTAWSAFNGINSKLRVSQNRELILVSLALGGFLLVGASGAVVALGDTLFPAESFIHGLSQDLSPDSHFLVRLRVIHPVMAISLAVYLLCLAIRYGTMSTLGILVVCQIALGGLTTILAAPIYLQMIHLVFADLVWISLVLTALKVVFGNRVGEFRALSKGPVSSTDKIDIEFA